MGSLVWANSLLIRVPGLQFDDQVSAWRYRRCALCKEAQQAVVEMLEMDPLDDGESQNHVVRTYSVVVGGVEPVCSEEADIGPSGEG